MTVAIEELNHEKDARALGKVDGITQDVGENKMLIQHISNNNNLRSFVRQNRVNEALQERVQPENLTQNNVQQDENEIQKQGTELPQNLVSAGSTANQVSEESFAPVINPTSQVLQSSPNGPTTGRVGAVNGHAIRGGRNGGRRGGYDGAGPAGGFIVRGRGLIVGLIVSQIIESLEASLALTLMSLELQVHSVC